ncbi:hypothetical protein TREMEDRAFT_26302 [Tremella mesenterica DSM 1558]|uniref:uncharacterized protein n=1 Tax=Tremella mesenterica (strain ATCC 24925 / CBS 8224 / DSM 1558 / NBRC 9311 / NRRL Y-6157 / RJB 2259-6 / UBC 559-6) TaxID=578456 RepID=UPI0003F48D27|nr:uncharacterized protein TREMEDRAFT_26302 [Tremella mesenterica DSM 1558]EIW72522.1 hypothetical protein TREMEDRAFT_26302 [Tremella mesenterica DSM 1558]
MVRQRSSGHFIKQASSSSRPIPTPSYPQRRRSLRISLPTKVAAAVLCVVIGAVLLSRLSNSRRLGILHSKTIKLKAGDVEQEVLPSGQDWGHGDFGDGRQRNVAKTFLTPTCDACYWVNTNLGNGGPEPDLSGGMIPAVAPPFAMTRWTPQTRTNYPSMCPYNQSDTMFHGFMGTHQPAIWMGESGPAMLSVGLGKVITDFEERGIPFDKSHEYASANYYSTLLNAEEGDIQTEMSATSRVGHLRFTFDAWGDSLPHVVVRASRASVLMSGDNVMSRSPHNVSYPEGWVNIDAKRKEIYGWNDERQDHILVGDELPATNFKGYFVARFSQPFRDVGISYDGKLQPGETQGQGKILAGYATFNHDVKVVDVRIGVSFISIDQARRNLDLEIPDGQTLEVTSKLTRTAWADKLDRLMVTGATPHNLTVLYTSFAHTLVYPYEVSENAGTNRRPKWEYYSGYLDKVVPGVSYSGYSIWDTFRSHTAWLLLVAPERVGAMIQSMLQDYKEGGWLPMWKNIVETNIMVGTHGDSIIAQAMEAGVKDFDWNLAWEAVKKNAFTPPERDTELEEEHTPQEVRAGLTEYMSHGYVAADIHAESGSRTLDYAYDDHAASIVATHLGAHDEAAVLTKRAKYYRNLWNINTGFMEARNIDGSFAGEKVGWTEGDHWAYSLAVMHDIPGLIELMGGDDKFVGFLDRHFDEGHNLHTNEPSHHIPYLYNFANAPHKTQHWVRQIARNEYNHTATGLSGNEDCGQMSAWYLFTALGFYPVDPASATYIIGAPLFDSLLLRLPGQKRPLRIDALGASDVRGYVRGLKVNGKRRESWVLRHDEIRHGVDLIFEMDGTPQAWGMTL